MILRTCRKHRRWLPRGERRFFGLQSWGAHWLPRCRLWRRWVGAGRTTTMVFCASTNAAARETPPRSTRIMIHHVASASMLHHGSAARTRSEPRTSLYALFRGKERRSRCAMPLHTTQLCLNNVPASVTASPRGSTNSSATMLCTTNHTIHWTSVASGIRGSDPGTFCN